MKSTNSHIGTIGLMLALIIAGGCASSTDTTSATAGYATSEQIDGDPGRIVCIREKDTGSRLSSRTCKTAREWERERLENQEAMRNAQRSGQRPSDLPTAGGG